MAWVPIGDADRRKMLRAIGLDRIEELFTSIPERLRLPRPLDLPPAHAEPDLRRRARALAGRNRGAADLHCFLGAGAYRHHVPAVVPHLLARSEFYSAYTPYQPEASQGTLQAIFEYQTLICQLTGMEIANASLYDGASALAEGVLLARRVRPGRRVLIAETVHPHYREVTRTYCRHADVELVPVAFGADGRIDAAGLEAALRGEPAAVVVQNPNFFGILEDLRAVGERAHAAGALFVVVVTDPVCLGILRAPGDLGADLVLGEAQAFGGALAFGGPFLGFLALRQEFLRELPGRLVGEARDGDGNRGFVLTLATREQHIRRARATSNICTNQGLCALAASIFLACLGRRGLREMAAQNLHKARYARDRLAGVPGCGIPFPAETFHEFVLELPEDAGSVAGRLEERGFLAGVPLGAYFPDLRRGLLVCVTEANRREEIDALAAALRKVL